MEIDKLIEKLQKLSDVLYADGVMWGRELCDKAAEVIRLQRECIVDGYNERWHRMIDDMEG